MIDKRYKVTQKDVDKIRLLREQGRTYQMIANRFNVSYSTVLYWCNDESRKKQRLKNAKRKHTAEETIIKVDRETKRRKRLFKENPKWKTHNAIQSAIDEKRCQRKTIMDNATGKRITMKQALKIYESKSYCLSNAKIK